MLKETKAGTAGLTRQLAVAQALTALALDTGGESIPHPRQAAKRLTAFERQERYTLTFRDPSGGDGNFHSIALSCRRPGVALGYRRGYRVPKDEERVLDQVFAQFLEAPHGENALGLSATVTGAAGADGRSLTRLRVSYSPPRESGGPSEREVEVIAVGKNATGAWTEPIRWMGKALPSATNGQLEATFDLGIPPGSFTWSVALRDEPTLLVAHTLVLPNP